MKTLKIVSNLGYTLIELVVVLVIMGILATVALRSLNAVNTTARYERTRQELDRLAVAVAGDPTATSGGVRTSYGYVGDVGALPLNLTALAINPGLATWNGPYVTDDFSSGGGSSEYLNDAWGRPYVYGGGVTIQSTGGPTTLTRSIAQSTAALLANTVTAAVVDLDRTPPGEDHRDSVRFILYYPNGSGGMAAPVLTPAPDGLVQFDNVPIGLHELDLVYLPTDDTVRRMVNVDPGTDFYTEVQYFADVWSETAGGGGGSPTDLEYVDNSDTLTSSCGRLSFWVQNNTGASISVSSLTTTWISPAGYYQQVYWNGAQVRSGSPALASGGLATFTGSRTIADGTAVRVQLRTFRQNSDGSGSTVNMSGAQFTIEFSDGSTITFTADTCI
jgi:prepilin-type N-terminal cleavage/methylation domain-containing protein